MLSTYDITSTTSWCQRTGGGPYLNVDEMEELPPLKLAPRCRLAVRPLEPNVQLVHPKLAVLHFQEVHVSKQHALVGQNLSQRGCSRCRSHCGAVLAITLNKNMVSMQVWAFKALSCTNEQAQLLSASHFIENSSNQHYPGT